MAGLKIFVSYTSADRDWAQWIAWTLKEAGHEPFVHEWEVGAGENIPAWMEDPSSRPIAYWVFSNGNTQAITPGAKALAAHRNDPEGRRAFSFRYKIGPVADWPMLRPNR